VNGERQVLHSPIKKKNCVKQESGEKLSVSHVPQKEKDVSFHDFAKKCSCIYIKQLLPIQTDAVIRPAN